MAETSRKVKSVARKSSQFGNAPVFKKVIRSGCTEIYSIRAVAKKMTIFISIRIIKSSVNYFFCFFCVFFLFACFEIDTNYKTKKMQIPNFLALNPIPPGLFDSGVAWGGGGGVPAAYNSKTINDNEMKLGGVVKDY